MQQNTDDTDPRAQELEHLLAENENLKQLLQEYQVIAKQKEKEQATLQQQAAAGIEMASSLENKSLELQHYKTYINELLQKAELAIQRENEMEKLVAGSVTVQHQLEDIKMQYDHLQAQLNDLSERLRQLKNQAVLQSQYAGRIAELESLLANAEEEIEILKNTPATD